MAENLYVSTSGAVARLSQLEILANNLANVDTVGFKSDEPMFETALESALLGAYDPGTPGGSAMSFVETAGVVTNHQTGPITRTDRALDAALQGPGFFVVETPAGVRYTRAGSFLVNADGLLSTPDGHPVLSEAGPIPATTSRLRIGNAGEVVDEQGTVVGRLRIEEFVDPEQLVKEGNNLFRAPPEAVGLPVENPALLAGSLERSNVQPTRELAVMMILQRAFEASMTVMRADDSATERLIQEISQ